MLERSARIVTVVTLSLALLYTGRALFIPLGFAVLFSFILYPVCRWLEQHRFSRGMAIATGLLAITLIIGSVGYLLTRQVSEFQKSLPTLETRFNSALDQLSLEITEHFNLSRDGQNAWLRNMAEKAVGMIGQLLFNTGSALVTLFIIPVYTALILYNRKPLAGLLQSFFPEERRSQIRVILHKTIDTYYNFIKGMAVVYLMVGLLNSLGLWALQIPQAFLFGFIASVLTFIPYVGIMIASLLPITVAWITKDSFWYPVGVVVVFAFVQYLEANLIFPLAVSSRLKLNTLVTLIVMFAGGMLWGAAGMILFIPLVAIAKLIADETDPGGKLARILGNGEA